MLKRYCVIAILLLVLIPAGVPAVGFQAGGGSIGCGCNAGGGGVSLPPSPLSSDEVYWLGYMRELERLARDVYRDSYRKWNLRIFPDIAMSEQIHTDAVKNLLERYGVPDPAAGKGEGQFTDPTLQNMYNTLTERGSISQREALAVGVDIELVDINGLEQAMAMTTHSDIRNVYWSLKRGSYHHLNAFNRQLLRS